MLISGKYKSISLSLLSSPLPPAQRGQSRARHMPHVKRSLGFLLIAMFLFGAAVSKTAAAMDGLPTADDLKNETLRKIDLLRVTLFVNYDKNSQPTTSAGVPTKITLGLSVNYIDIDELNGKMTLHSWLRARWMDGNRTWNPAEYDNITQIHLKPRDVWKPQITLFNSAGDGGDYLGDTQIILAHDGSFLWVPPAVYTAYCNLNLALWPYDTQICKLRVGTWTLTYIDSQYLSSHESMDFQEMVQSTEWEIIDSKPTYHQKDFYNYVEFTFTMKRRSSMYAAIIFTPASCIILLALSSFWLPPQMGEKILLNSIVIVVIAAFLMYFAQLLPILAENTPLVVLFYSSSMLLLSISTMIAVIVLYLSTAKHKKRVPELIKRLLNGPVGNVLLLAHFTIEAEPQSFANHNSKEMTDNVYEQPNNEHDISDLININSNPVAGPDSCPRSIQYSWVLLATAIDRICFLLYSLIFIVLAIVYTV